jgi:hypothetical protein
MKEKDQKNKYLSNGMEIANNNLVNALLFKVNMSLDYRHVYLNFT